MSVTNRIRVPQELLEAIERDFPDRLPREDADGRLPSTVDIARLVGQQDVLRKLRALHRIQHNP